MANKDFINILQEIRGKGAPGDTYTDGIWYELAVADKNGNDGMYGDILAKYGVITESAGTFDQAVDILENLNVEITTLEAGTNATSALVNGVWQLGLPKGTDGTDGLDGSTPEVAISYSAGNLNYTITVDGSVVTNGVIGNLDSIVDSVVNTNIDVQTTLTAKDTVLGAVATAQNIVDTLETNVSAKKAELDSHTTTKTDAIDAYSDAVEATLENAVTARLSEYNTNASISVNNYDNNHTAKVAEYDANTTVRLGQYNDNHISRIDSLNGAYASRIIDMLNTKRMLGMMDQFNVSQTTQMIPFISTDSVNYTYYVNGVNLELGVDYTVYDSTRIELTTPVNPSDIVVQVDISILNATVNAAIESYTGLVLESDIGIANGVAGLDANGVVPSAQLPSYVDDVIEVATYEDLPTSGETGKIYVVVADETSGEDTSSYRWTGTVYAMVSNTLSGVDIKVLYEANDNTNVYDDEAKNIVSATSGTNTGDQDLSSYDTHIALTNAHIDWTAEGAGTIHSANYTNTTYSAATPGTDGTDGVDGLLTDSDKFKLDNIEDSATADQIASEVPVTPVGNIEATNVQSAIEELDAEKEPKNANIQSHISSSTNPHSVTKTQVGLGSVDNTSDVDKPVSTAQQAALNLQAGLIAGNTNSILQLAKSNTYGAFGTTGISLSVTSTPKVLPFNVITQSSNTDRFEINNDNTITAKVSGTYVFTSTINVEDTGGNGSVVPLTFRITDGTTIWYTEVVEVEISGYDRDIIAVNSLVVLPPEATVPDTAYITVSCPFSDNGDYAIVGFHSILSTEKTVAELQGLASGILVEANGGLSESTLQYLLENLQSSIDALESSAEADLSGLEI